MIIIQLLQHLLHDRFTEKHCLGTYTKLLAILIDGGHLAVVQVDNLPVATHQSRLLLFKVLRIYIRMYLLFWRHC